MDEDESEQEDSSVHSSSVRSDSSGRVKKNKRGRPAKKKKKSKRGLFVNMNGGAARSALHFTPMKQLCLFNIKLKLQCGTL